MPDIMTFLAYLFSSTEARALRKLMGSLHCQSTFSMDFSETTRTISIKFHMQLLGKRPGCVAQLVGHLTRKSGVLGSIPGLATYFRFSFRFFKKGSCQLLAKVCARSTG